MDKTVVWRVTSAGLAAVVAAIVVILLVAARGDYPAHGQFADAAAALAFISGAAVGIERAIEAFWTMVGGIKGSYWPLKAIHDQVDDMVTNLDAAMENFHEVAAAPFMKTAAELTDPAGKFKSVLDAQREIQSTITASKARIDALKNLAPDNQRVQLLAATASQSVNYISAQYGDAVPELAQAGRAVNAAISGLQDFLATFKDNPGRRLVSIYIGVTLGLAISGTFSLDVVNASLGNTSSEPSVLNVILTGILIGLGSNPTHEVIRAIQEFKKSQKGENVAKPDLPTLSIGDTLDGIRPTGTAAPAVSLLAAQIANRLPDRPRTISA